MAATVVTGIRQMSRVGGIVTHIDSNGETQFLYVDRPTAAYLMHGGQLDLEAAVPEHERTGRLPLDVKVRCGTATDRELRDQSRLQDWLRA